MSYKDLKSYQQATIVYDYTVEFCNLYIVPDKSNRINKSYRTADQMVQAARSGKQNIAEGSANPTSEKSELHLTGVARASFDELLEDYEDFLRQRGLRQWDKDSPEARDVRALAYKSNRSYRTYRSYIDNAETAANCAICLIHQTNFLLDRQLKSLEEQFVKRGGFTENLRRRREDEKKRKLGGGMRGFYDKK